MTRDYREQFATDGVAEQYDSSEYEQDSYGSLLWSIEQEYLKSVLKGLRSHCTPLRYLDFACGSGRVLSFLESEVDEATGIDVSAPMLARAKTRVQRSELVLGDIAEDEGVLGHRRFDLITAFRFFLNAQPDLRLQAMRGLAGRLASPESRLVLNNHGNLFSHKLALAPVHILRRRGRPSNAGNYLSHRQIERLVFGAGLEIESVYGYGLLSARAAAVVSNPTLGRIERSLAGVPFVHRAGVNQIYVVRKRVD